MWVEDRDLKSPNINVSIDIEIALINKIIKEAMDHGGDQGGPYWSNQEDLKSAIKEWLIYKNLNNKYYVGKVKADYVYYIQIKKISDLAR